MEPAAVVRAALRADKSLQSARAAFTRGRGRRPLCLCSRPSSQPSPLQRRPRRPAAAAARAPARPGRRAVPAATATPRTRGDAGTRAARRGRTARRSRPVPTMSVRRASSARSCRAGFLPPCPLAGAAGEAIVSTSDRQSCVRQATRASPMAAPNHVLCLCRRTRRLRTPGSLQRSPLPGPGPPLSSSPRGTQRCLLR